MRAALVLFVLLLVPAFVFAEYEVTELKGPKRILYRAMRDVDGDGMLDLLVLNSEEVFFWKGRAGAWPAKPDARLALPKGTVFFDFADIEPDAPGQELVARTADAYWSLRPGREAKKLPQASGPGLPRNADNLLWRSLTVDLDRDGKLDLVDVALGKFTIHFGAGGEVVLPVEPTEKTDTTARLASERYIARYSVGTWTDGGFDDDEIPDFAVVRGAEVIVFPGDEKGRPSAERSFRIKLPVAETSDLNFLRLNADTKTDVVAVDRASGKAKILYAHPELGLRRPATVELSVPGRMRWPILADLDGDGWKDLALPYHPRPNLGAMVQAAVRGEVPVRVPVFLNRPTRRPSIARVADASFTFPVKIRLRSDAGGRITVQGLVVVEYEGDLTGDGRPDLVVSQRPDRLAVHRGVPVTVFHEKASKILPIPDSSGYESIASNAADLNGDKRSDIILQYRGFGEQPDRLLLLLSGKK